MPLTRDQILKAEDLKREEVPVPEWGGSVFVRTMTGGERDRFEAAFVRDKTDTRARLAAATICDEAGTLLFSATDIEALGRKSAAALERVFVVAMRLSKVGKADVDDLEKNSAAATSASTPSA
jgi:hypothetical protein